MRLLRYQRDGSDARRRDAGGLEHLRGGHQDPYADKAAEPESHERVRSVDLHVAGVPALLDRAARIEVDLVRHERGRDEANDEIPIDGGAVRLGHEAATDLAPIRLKLQRR